MGAFYYAAKAFDVLERLDPDPEYWEGKRGACVGVFQKVIAGQERIDSLRDVVSMLRNTMNPQVRVARVAKCALVVCITVTTCMCALTRDLDVRAMALRWSTSSGS